MHNVTERDGVFTVRGAAWWDLDGSHDLTEYPSRQLAQSIAHPWEPEREPLYRKLIVPRDYGPPEERYEAVPDAVLNVRSDTRASIGVTPPSLGIVNNSEMYDIAEAIEGEDGGVQYETGGSLLGGRKVWLLLRLREPIVVAGDPHGTSICYYCLQNSHDGSGAFRGQATVTRVVCDNTSKMADVDAQSRGTEIVFRHTKNVHERIEDAKRALAGWRSSIAVYQEVSADLLTQKVTDAQALWFAEEFIPMPPPHTASDRVVANVEEARRAFHAILSGETCEGINNTAYGLVQASVEYNQHARAARSKESRFKRAYLDRSDILVDAMRIAQEAGRS